MAEASNLACDWRTNWGILEYYIVNRGDERKLNKRTGSSCSTNLKSSRLGCLVFRDSVSTELEGSLLGDPIIPEWIKFLQ